MEERYFNHDIVPNYSTKQVIQKYYDVYFENLKNLTMKMEWVKVMDLEVLDPRGWRCLDDMFLDDTAENPINLGYDIKENGTYWCICLDKEDDKYIIKDGVHRIASIRKLIVNNELPEDFEMLAIIRTEKITPQNCTYKFPMNFVTTVFKDFYKGMYDIIFRDDELVKDSKEEFLVVSHPRFAYLSVMMYSLLLRNAMFEYKKNNGVAFPSSDIVNNKETWNDWFNK